MFEVQIRIGAQKQTFEDANKLIKAVRRTGKRHNAVIEIERFGGDNTPGGHEEVAAPTV